MSTQLAIPEAQEFEKPEQALTPAGMLQIALQNSAGIEIIERLQAMIERARDYEAQVSFDEALSRCQAKISRIAADADNKQTKSRYATYAKLDKVVRPIYTAENFAVSFTERDCPNLAKTRFVALLSRQGITREYIKDMTPSTKGPQGADFMTPIHADATADSYAKRYLLKDIFNIAIGEEDADGNGDFSALAERLEWIANARNMDELRKLYENAKKEAQSVRDVQAMRDLAAAKDKRKKELQ